MASKLIWKSARLFTIFAVLICGIGISHAQQFVINNPPIGLPSNGTFDGTNFDQVNMQAGNLHISIPLVQRQERGEVQNDLTLVYDNEDWELYEDCSTGQYCVPVTYPGPAMQWKFATPGFTIDLTPGICGSSGIIGQGSVIGPGGYNNSPYEWEYYSYDVIDQDNTRHHMVPDTSDEYLAQVTNYIGGGIPVDSCAPLFHTDTIYAVDGSGISYDPTNIGDMPDPRRSRQGPTDIAGNAGTFDGNGNGTLASDPSMPPEFGLATGYYDTSGTLRSFPTTTITMLVDHAPLGDGFDWHDCPSNDDCLTNWIQPPAFHGYITLISSVTLPNGTAYYFTYDPTFGDLTSVQLPTGGTISWTYEPADPTNYSNNGRAIRTRMVVANPGAPPQTWQYFGDGAPSYLGTIGSLASYVIDPLNQKTSYTFDQYGNQTRKEVFDTAGALIDKATSTVGFSSICQTGNSMCDDNQQRVLHTDYTLPLTGQVSSVVYDYDGIELCWFDNSRCKNIALHQISSESTYDYGQGSHGPLLKQESTTYLHLPDSGIFNRPLTRTISGPSNSSSESWTYDNYGSGMTVTTGVPAHDYTQYSSTYTSRGNLTSHSMWDSSSSTWLSTTYTYDDLGNRLTSTDPKGNTTHFSYDDVSDGVCNPPVNTHAYLTLVTDALGHRTKAAYNFCASQITEVWDENQLQANGPGTRYTYDYMKQQTEATDPLGGQTTWDYHSYANPLTVTITKTATPDPDIVSTTIHDGLGRIAEAIANPGGPGTKSIIDTTYDELGRVHSVSNPYSTTSNGSTVFTYDALNRKTNALQSDGTNQQWAYLGNVTTYTDEATNSWSRANDALGRLTGVTEPGGLQTVYAYDGLGNLKAVNQTGIPGETPRVRSFSYDSLSRLLWSQNPETGVMCYGQGNGSVAGCQPNGYDANGNLLYKTDARGVISSFAYDALNRVTSKHYSDGVTRYQLFGYDGDDEFGNIMPGAYAVNAIGRLSHTSDQIDVSSNFAYDAMGRLIVQQGCLVINCMPGFTFSPTYDLAGNPTSLTYPDGRVVTQTWDGAGRLAKVSSGGVDYISGGSGNGITYTAAGAMQSAVLGNGVAETFDFNSRLQPCHALASSAILPTNPTGGNLFDRVSLYSSGGTPCANEPNNNGNIHSITDKLQVGNSQSFSYDPLNRLLTASRSDGAYNHTYIYDSFGNMRLQDILAPVSSVVWNIDPATNRLLRSHDGGVTWGDNSYDMGGNLQSTTDGIGSSISYQYNANNQVLNINSGQTASYLYDAMDQRVFKQTPLGTTDYIYFNNQPIAEKDQTGAWTDYIYANGQKIAKVDSSDTRVHLSAVYQPTSDGGRWTVAILPIPANVTIQPGDVLSFRMYQHNANGSISLGFTDGSNSDWYCGQCGAPVSVSDQWANASIPIGGSVSSPGVMAGKTLGYFFAGQHQGGPNGEFDVMIADIALLHSDGTVTPFPMPMGNIGWGGETTDVTSGSCVGEQVSPSSGSIGAIADTHYYLDDHLGTTQMELSAGGWPVWEGQFMPFGGAIVNGAPLLPGQPDGSSMHYKFAGKERDAESGLDYFGARYYGSNMGRMMSPDWSARAEPVPYASLDDPQSLNLYSYVGNNPLRRIDPDGHCPKGLGLLCKVGHAIADAGQSVNNGLHGLGLHTNKTVDNTQRRDTHALARSGLSTEGLSRRQVLKAYGLAAAGGFLKRPSAAQARAIWEQATGGKVPYDESMGRYYDMAHKHAIGDGGDPRDPENLEPMLHRDHVQSHIDNDDFSRWAQRARPNDATPEPGDESEEGMLWEAAETLGIEEPEEDGPEK